MGTEKTDPTKEPGTAIIATTRLVFQRSQRKPDEDSLRQAPKVAQEQIVAAVQAVRPA